jgi:DNA-binding response OmpR family regulator
MGGRIVIVDDDLVTAQVIEFLLQREGFETVAVSRGSLAFAEVIGRETRLVILDVNLTDINGFALCKELRARRYNGPVIFITARGDVQDKVEGFRVGGIDYIVKPYEPLEVVARVHSAVRRHEKTDQMVFGTVLRVEDAELSIGELTYSSNVASRILMTPTEMQILECLMRNSRIVLSRETLVERVWGYDFVGETNRVDVYIHRLRNKIERDPTNPRYLHTVRGIGYVFRVDPEPHAITELPVHLPQPEGLSSIIA